MQAHARKANAKMTGWLTQLGRLALAGCIGALLGLAAAFGSLQFAQQKTAEISIQLNTADPAAPLSADELAAEATALIKDPTAATADPIAGLKVIQDVNAATLTLRLQSEDGALASGILTRLAEAYAGRAQAELPDFLLLARNTGSLKQQLTQTEARLVALKSELADLQATGASGELKQQIANAEQKAEETRATAAAVRRAMDAGTAANSTLRPLKTPQLDELRLERDGLLADIDAMTMDVVTDDPRLLDARFELRRLEARINELVDRIAASLESDSRTAMNRAADLRARLGALGKAEELEKQQSELFESVATLRASLEQSLTKLAAHQASNLQARFSVRLTGHARVFVTSTLPSLRLSMMLAGLGAFAAILLSIIIRPRVAKPAAPSERVERAMAPVHVPEAPKAEAPARQVIIAPPEPPARSDDWQQSFTAAARILAEASTRPAVLYETSENEVAADQPGAVMSSEVRRIGVWLSELMERPGIRMVGISGIHPSSADSAALAVELARKLAAELPRVVLVDLSTQPQMLQRLLPMGGHGGTLADFTAGRASLSDVISREDQSGLHWVEGSPGSAGPRLATMLQALSAAYDVVVLHLGSYTQAPPAGLMACEAVAVTAPMLDAIEARKVMEGLRQAGVAHTEFVASSGSGSQRSRAA